MNKRILMALVASVVVAIVGAPVAGANPVSTQYDQPSVTPPPVTQPPVTQPPVTEPSTSQPSTSQPSTSEPAPKVEGTSNTVKNASVVTTPKPAQVTKVASSDTLPFTGLDLGLFLMIGSVAVASGLGLRRVAARRSLDQ